MMSESKKELEQVDFLNAINKLGIGGADVCVHASVKSFGAKINCGIKGIVNYTPCVLKVPIEVPIENVSLLTALETLAIN